MDQAELQGFTSKEYCFMGFVSAANESIARYHRIQREKLRSQYQFNSVVLSTRFTFGNVPARKSFPTPNDCNN